MNLKESLGDLVLRCDAAGTADITTVATLLQGARDANYFGATILKGPDDPPGATKADRLTAAAVVAAAKEAIEIKPVDPPLPDPEPVKV